MPYSNFHSLCGKSCPVNAGSAKFLLHRCEFRHGGQTQAETLEKDQLVLVGLADASFAQGDAIARRPKHIDESDFRQPSSRRSQIMSNYLCAAI